MKRNEVFVVFNTRFDGNVEKAPRLFNTLKKALVEMYTDIYYLTEKEMEDNEFFINVYANECADLIKESYTENKVKFYELIESDCGRTIINKDELNSFLNYMNVDEIADYLV